MTKTDFLCLAPLLVIATAPIVIMLTVTIRRNFRVVYIFSLIMFLLAFLSLLLVLPHTTRYFYPLLVFDNFSLLFLGIIYFTSIIVTVLSYGYLRQHSGEREEYFIVMFVAVLGASVLVTAEHFVSFFLGLETLSISLYILIAYLRGRDQCIEAGVKFLVIASLATAFLLFGMGLIYAGTGNMNFREIYAPEGSSGAISPLMLAGFGLIFAGIGFKLAVVPFHMWTPDIYQGAPVPVTTFIATISKGAVMALALRLVIDTESYDNGKLVVVISIVSILSMFAGNLLALNQDNLKRLLAYSSIAHLGYLLIPLVTGTKAGIESAVFYVAAYIISTLGAFGVVSAMSVRDRDADDINDMKGMFRRDPLLAGVLTLALLSLAGLPLTAGFMSKFFLVLAGVKSGLWLLAFSLIINSVISLYYYLRVVKVMFTSAEPGRKIQISLITRMVLVLIAAGILILGILPSYLMELIGRFSDLG